LIPSGAGGDEGAFGWSMRLLLAAAPRPPTGIYRPIALEIGRQALT